MRPGTPTCDQPGSLHKRRASASPDKLRATQMNSIKITTGLEDLSTVSSTPRGWTENRIEICQSANGAVQNKSAHEATALNSAESQIIIPMAHDVSDGEGAAYQQPRAKQRAQERKKVFSLLGAFVRDNSLLLALTSYLDVPSIISLYAISKSFHLSFNRHTTAFVLSSMRTWAPGADMIFPWRCYRSLCIGDPIKRQKAIPKTFEAEVDRLKDNSRDVPSLRWLQMVVWREAISADMLMQLNSKALRNPRGTHDAVKRLWFVLDMPLNAQRLAVFRSQTYFSDQAIYRATSFLIRCDMAFTDPGIDPFPLNHPNQAMFPNQWAFAAAVGCNLREKLTAERNFTALWRVLKGLTWDMDEPPRPLEASDIVKLNVKHKFRWPAGTSDAQLRVPIMGMWYSDMRFVGCERIYRRDDDVATKLKRPCRPLISLEKLLMGEGVRRAMHFEMHFLDMITWGFMLPGKRNVPVITVEKQRMFLRKPGDARRPARAPTLAATLMRMQEWADDGTRV